MKTIRKTVFLILLCIFVLSSCSSGREYYDDIVVQFENDEAEIVIREWSFLLGSGAEIYCNIGGKMTLLGQISGMDNSFCPFSKGLDSSRKLNLLWRNRLYDR